MDTRVAVATALIGLVIFLLLLARQQKRTQPHLNAALTVLCGPAGSGKTTLAARLANQPLVAVVPSAAPNRVDMGTTTLVDIPGALSVRATALSRALGERPARVALLGYDDALLAAVVPYVIRERALLILLSKTSGETDCFEEDVRRVARTPEGADILAAAGLEADDDITLLPPIPRVRQVSVSDGALRSLLVS